MSAFTDYDYFLDQGVRPIPAALLCIAEAIASRALTLKDGDSLSHGIVMAARHLSENDIAIPLRVDASVDHTSEGCPGIELKGEVFIGNTQEQDAPIEVKIVDA